MENLAKYHVCCQTWWEIKTAEVWVIPGGLQWSEITCLLEYLPSKINLMTKAVSVQYGKMVTRDYFRNKSLLFQDFLWTCTQSNDITPVHLQKHFQPTFWVKSSWLSNRCVLDLAVSKRNETVELECICMIYITECVLNSLGVSYQVNLKVFLCPALNMDASNNQKEENICFIYP